MWVIFFCLLIISIGNFFKSSGLNFVGIYEMPHWLERGTYWLERGTYWLERGTSASEDVVPKRGGLWDLTLVGEWNKSFFIRVWKPLPSRHVLKLWGENLKRTISTRGRLGRLQIVWESDTGRCANEDAEPRRRVDCEIPHQLERRTRVSEDAGPRKGVDWSWRGEQSMLYKSVETSP